MPLKNKHLHISPLNEGTNIFACLGTSGRSRKGNRQVCYCPVSPKAIYTQECFNTVRDGILTVKKVTDDIIEIEQTIVPHRFASGDYYCALEGDQRRKIAANNENSLEISPDEQFAKMPLPGSKIEVQVRLQQPFVDIEKCIGCGVCEHECPVSGRKAIRVSAEGETRSTDRTLLLDSGPQTDSRKAGAQ